MSTGDFTRRLMSRRLITLIAAATLGGCSGSLTAPMSCQDNPKCKADTQPAVLNKPTLAPAAPAIPSGELRAAKPQAVGHDAH